MNNFLRFSIYFITLMSVGCTKYPAPLEIIDEPEVCNDLPPFAVNKPWDIVRTGPYSYYTPKFNRSNQEEIFYFRSRNDLYIDENNRDLVSYNMRTGEFKIILTNLTLKVTKYEPGVNGWILFQSINKEIWKVKTDGTDLTRITNVLLDGEAINPSWSHDGRYLSYLNKKRNINIVGDVVGNPVDSFKLNKGSSGVVSFSSYNNLLTGRSVDGTTIYQYNTDLDKQVRTVKTNGSRVSFAVFPGDNEMILLKNDSIFLVKLYENNAETFLRPMCSSKIYSEPSISPDGQRILFTKDILSTIDNNTISDASEIWVMDRECKRAKKVEVR